MSKLLKTLFLLFLFGSEFLNAQNWPVFNKNYRYNYSLQNENYTTVVIFADSTLTQGTDTTYSLNRIAAKCDSCFFYYPQSGVADSNFIMGNQPQFMQRRIIYSNNQYRLSDTSNYIIPRFSNVNDSWVFNSARAITATVIGANIKTYFGVSDSVRTILLSTNDTIIISKQFGIVKYPAKFGQHIYYKLRGIETKLGNALNSLHGEKVPNYFEFSQLLPGVEHYYSERHASYQNSPNNNCYRHVFGRKTILSSSISGTVITNTYRDEVKGCPSSCGTTGVACNYNPAFYPASYPSTTFTITSATAINSPFFIDKVFNTYNNKLYSPYGGPSPYYYVVKFGMTNNQHFYKTYGLTCFASNIQNSPMARLDQGCFYYQSSQNSNVYYTKYDNMNQFNAFGETYIQGYGQVNSFFQGFESDDFYCSSVIIDGNDTLGDFTVKNIVTSMQEDEQHNYASGYPNPTKDIVTIPLPFETTSINASITLTDVFGKQLSQKVVPVGSTSEKVNLQNMAQGIYFVEVKMPHFQRVFKVIKE